MHELSIAQTVLEIVQQNVPEQERPNVRTVTIKVGALSGIVPESLEFCYQSFVADTSLATSSLRFDRIPFRVQCNRCLTTAENENGFTICRQCGSGDTRVLSGDELQVVTIELDDAVKEPL